MLWRGSEPLPLEDVWSGRFSVLERLRFPATQSTTSLLWFASGAAGAVVLAAAEVLDLAMLAAAEEEEAAGVSRSIKQRFLLGQDILCLSALVVLVALEETLVAITAPVVAWVEPPLLGSFSVPLVVVGEALGDRRQTALQEMVAVEETEKLVAVGDLEEV